MGDHELKAHVMFTLGTVSRAPQGARETHPVTSRAGLFIHVWTWVVAEAKQTLPGSSQYDCGRDFGATCCWLFKSEHSERLYDSWELSRKKSEQSKRKPTRPHPLRLTESSNEHKSPNKGGGGNVVGLEAGICAACYHDIRSSWILLYVLHLNPDPNLLVWSWKRVHMCRFDM